MKIIITCHTELAGTSDGIKSSLEIIENYGSKICFALMPEVIDRVRQRTLNKILEKEQEIEVILQWKR